MLKKLLKIFLCLLAFGPMATHSEHEEFLGLWQTTDDETNKPRSVVKIYLDKKILKGNIVQFFPEPDEAADPLCDQCKGERYNRKIIGMQIIDEMQFKKGKWKNGVILDPKNGKFYDCKIWLEGNKLKVRGYIGFFFRTQKWKRYIDSTIIE
jgi:uncharacterized protein (DUF2147 family)